DSRERGPLRRLPDDGVATDGRDGRVPRPDRHWEVEGGDHTDGAEGVPLLVHAVLRPLRGDGEPVELTGETYREVADVDHLLHLSDALGEDLAHLQGDQGAELLDVLPEGVAQPADVLAPFRGGKLTPALEGLHRVGDDLLVVLGRGHGHLRQGLAGGRVGDVDGLTGRLEPLPRVHTRVDLGDAEVLQDLLCSHRAATTSISTRKPPGSAPAWIVDRAGGSSEKWEP